MKKLLPFLVLFLSLLVSTPLISAPCSGITIFYANGMNNEWKDANDSLKDLRIKLLPILMYADSDIDFQLAYNQKEGVISQIVEVATEKGMDRWKSFWNFLNGVEVAPDWFQEEVNNIIIVATDELNAFVDADLREQVADYKKAISNGRKVIVVAHSQGNFYANDAYGLVNSPSFGIVSVATPAFYVAGDGPYITLTTDKVINLVVRPLSALAELLPPKPANETNNTDGGRDWMGHDFVSAYLEGDKSGQFIEDNVLNVATQLPKPSRWEVLPECEAQATPLTVKANITLASCVWCNHLTVTIDGQSLSAGHTNYPFEIYLDGSIPGLQEGEHILSLSFDQMIFGDWRDGLVANGTVSMSLEIEAGAQDISWWLVNDEELPTGFSAVMGAGTYSWPFVIKDNTDYINGHDSVN